MRSPSGAAAQDVVVGKRSRNPLPPGRAMSRRPKTGAAVPVTRAPRSSPLCCNRHRLFQDVDQIIQGLPQGQHASVQKQDVALGFVVDGVPRILALHLGPEPGTTQELDPLDLPPGQLPHDSSGKGLRRRFDSRRRPGTG